MGKPRGELNVSSDVDLVFVYPETARPTARAPANRDSSTGWAGA
jgi:glutamine synthetase adenylyltransferase